MMSSGTQTLLSLCLFLLHVLASSRQQVSCSSPSHHVTRHKSNQRTREAVPSCGSLEQEFSHRLPSRPPFLPHELELCHVAFLKATNSKGKRVFCSLIRARVELGVGSSSPETTVQLPAASLLAPLSTGSAIKIKDIHIGFKRPRFWSAPCC